MSEKISVARNSALASLGMTILKLAVGLATGSLALISEGIHSSLDLLATLTTFMSVRAADRPADEDHHFGHGKWENLSAFAEALLLIVAAFLIIVEAIGRLRHPHPPDTDKPIFWAAIGVVTLSMIVDFSRSAALARAARKYRSQALEADALHFRIELLSSGMVLAGLLLVKVGGSELQWVDSVAALGVALVMGYVASQLAKRSADVLTDRAPVGLEGRMQETIRKVPGVADVPRVRTRQSGAHTFVDATITVDPKLGLKGGHHVASLVELAVTEQYPQTDILVHVEPAEDPLTDYTAAVRNLAQNEGLNIHALRIREIDDGLYIYFHVELPGDMTVAQAHSRVTEFEHKLRTQLPRVAEIDSHAEPEGGKHDETSG